MKLRIGPPGVGKLTIATRLAKLTGYRLFLNHLMQDLAEELYPEFGEQKFKLVNTCLHYLCISVFRHRCSPKN